MTVRLSAISVAGTVRTLVAVGTDRLASMVRARLFAVPRNGVAASCTSAVASVGVLRVWGGSAGVRCDLAGVAGVAGVDVVGETPRSAAAGEGSSCCWFATTGL